MTACVDLGISFENSGASSFPFRVWRWIILFGAENEAGLLLVDKPFGAENEAVFLLVDEPSYLMLK